VTGPVGASPADLVARYLTWALLRWAAFQGYWLVTMLYLVTVAELSPFQLVFLGTAMEATVLVAEIPTGVVADTVSRKRSIVVSHVLMGVGMAGTGLFTDFGPLVATQMLWGLGWTFASGADVAWLTDEVGHSAPIDSILARAAGRQLLGAAAGIVGFGLLGWATTLATAIVVAGLAMIALGGLVAIGFPERHFSPTVEHRWRESKAIFGRGLQLAGRDRRILRMFGAVALISAGAEAYDRLYPKRLVSIGFPAAPVVWFSLLGVAALTVGALVLRGVQRRIERPGAAGRAYGGACGVGAVGLVLLAAAPDPAFGVAGVLFVGGIAWTVTRSVSVIWVNRRATSDVRATVQSFLGQVESLGEVTGGLVFAVVAQALSVPTAFVCSSVLVALSGLLVVLDRPHSPGGDPLGSDATGPSARAATGTRRTWRRPGSRRPASSP
jgi:MFS family permease